MLENALKLRNASRGKMIAMKTMVSAELTVLAVLLPQLVHVLLGQPGGVKWLPMYLPILVGGCLLGAKWGLVVGVMSPLASFVLTSAMGSPMPVAERLPYMLVELAVFAVVTGLFTKKIANNGLWSIPAVILAQLCGRGVFLGLVFLFQSVSKLCPQMVWSQIQTGFAGIAVQAVLVPVVIIALRKVLINGKEND